MVDELVETALDKHRRGERPGNIAAIFERDASRSGLDGQQWSFFVTDGVRVERIEAKLSGTARVAVVRTVNRSLLEAAVERRAVNAYPVESRMDDLVAASPVVLRAEDLRPHPTLPSGFL